MGCKSVVRCDYTRLIISFNQGVVTLIGPVEPFATQIKMKSRSICTKSSDQGTFQRSDQAAHRIVRLYFCILLNSDFSQVVHQKINTNYIGECHRAS